MEAKMPEKELQTEFAVIRQMQKDISFLKERVKTLEDEVSEIDNDVHKEIRPEFLKRLETVQKQKGVRFNNMKEFDEFISRD